MRKKSKLVSGICVNDFEGVVNKNGKMIKSYTIWKAMLQRCYSEKLHLKYPTYIGCSVCDEWLLFSNFKKWFDENYKEGFNLDKDILVEGNKIYSPDTCRFVPTYINNLLTDRRNARGCLPLGIAKQMSPRQINPTYKAQCNNGYGNQLNKGFSTIQEAQAWYTETKTRIVKEQALRAFMEGEIKTDIYLALVRRKF